MNDDTDSIFRRYYAEEEFIDRFSTAPENAVDVIIPIIHTNELWEANLRSIYREVPVNRILLGDGGCIDGSVDRALKFPRVKVLDHKDFKTLGYSLRHLIEAVETPWFIYLHSDVYVPEGWFAAMTGHQREYDWFGCPMRHTVMVEYPVIEKQRPYAGSQMGRTAAFQAGVKQIDDDFVYRQEDFVLAEIIEQAGFKHGRIEDTFHYHQTMYKPSAWGRKVKSVSIDTEATPAEEVRTWMMQCRGIIKYLKPTNEWVTYNVMFSVNRLFELGELNAANWDEFCNWVRETDPDWLPYLPKPGAVRTRLRGLASAALRRLNG